MDVGKRLSLMDHLGVERQLLSPNPLTYFHHIEPEVAAGTAVAQRRAGIGGGRPA